MKKLIAIVMSMVAVLVAGFHSKSDKIRNNKFL